jgi:hypothetical protein
MRLYHFSDDPEIAAFVPRPVLVPSQRVAGMEWLNGPLVWAIEEDLDFLYHFPRECPRILVWAKAGTSAADTADWLGPHRAAAYIERSWLERFAAAVLYRYELPPEPFESLDDAGMHVSRVPVTPVACTRLSDLPAGFAPRNVDLRVVDSLTPLRGLWNTSLHTSGIRLRNAAGWY